MAPKGTVQALFEAVLAAPTGELPRSEPGKGSTFIVSFKCLEEFCPEIEVEAVQSEPAAKEPKEPKEPKPKTKVKPRSRQDLGRFLADLERDCR